MHIDELLRPHRRCLSEAKRSAYQDFAHTADLSALSVAVMMSAFKSYSALSGSDAPSMVTNQHFLSRSRCYFFTIPASKTLTRRDTKTDIPLHFILVRAFRTAATLAASCLGDWASPFPSLISANSNEKSIETSGQSALLLEGESVEAW